MQNYPDNWAVVVPLANEEQELPAFHSAIRAILDSTESGVVYLVIDNASKDRTLECCREIATKDPRFVVAWLPENRNVVDAYMNGFRFALRQNHEIIIEMDGGLSHDPRAIPAFLRALNEGNDCAFGSRYINGGSMVDSSLWRRCLSKGGTLLARVLLGARLTDMTSGYQAFRRETLIALTSHPLKSKAHFYQTEVRHLLRRHKWIEVPIHYRAPSPSVSRGAILNSIRVLLEYTLLRVTGRSPSV